jgi:hypothetical protein
VSLGVIHPSKEEVKDVVKQWYVSINRSFVVKGVSNKAYKVKCLRTDCPFRVRASKGKWSKQWKCAAVVDHTCVLHELEVAHGKLTLAFITIICTYELLITSTTSLNQQSHKYNMIFSMPLATPKHGG